MSTPARTRPRTAALVGVLLVALVAGCGGSRDEGPSTGTAESPRQHPETDAGPSRSPEPIGKAAGVPTRLGPGDPRPKIVCEGGERVGGSVDHAAGAKGDPTPEAAVESRLAEGESFVMTENGRTAWVLRPDGTAHTRLELLHQRGWSVHLTDGCPG